MSFAIHLNVYEMSLYLSFSLFCISSVPNWISSGSFLTCRWYSSLFIRDKILLKNSQNLSSANYVLRRVRPVDVECFPPTWPRIKHVFTCLYSKESLKKPLAHTTKDSVISITVTSSDKKLWWTVPFHHLYIRIKVTLPNDFLPSVASFNALFRQDHRFLNIFLLWVISNHVSTNVKIFLFPIKTRMLLMSALSNYCCS